LVSDDKDCANPLIIQVEIFTFYSDLSTTAPHRQ